MGNGCTWALALLLFLAGCAVDGGEPVAEAPAAIQGGALDLRDSGVVGVALVDALGTPRRTCTGTLIAPNLVLTAQHCVADTRKLVDCAQSVFGPPVAPERVRVTTSPSLWSDGIAWAGAVAVSVPPGASHVCGRDVALIVLESPLAVLAAPLGLRLDAAVRDDEPYAAIGYGRSSDESDDGGMRRRRDQLRVVCVGDDCGSLQIADDEWRGDHGICSGDSGGPAVDAEGGVIGVTSRGPAGCERPIYGALAPHGGWLRQEARAAAEMGGYPAPGWVGVGQRGVAREVGSSDFVSGRSCAVASTPPGAPGAPGDPWGWTLLAAGLVAGARTRRVRACFRGPSH